MPRDLDAIDVQSFLTDPFLNGLLTETCIDPCTQTPDPVLVAQWGADVAARSGVLPWRVMGGRTIVLASSPEVYEAHRASLDHTFGQVRRAKSLPERLTAATQKITGAELIERAETRPDPEESCRDLSIGGRRALMVGGVALACAALAPAAMLITLCLLAILASLVGTILKIAALIAGRPPKAPALLPEDLPRISLMVPLFHEPEIAGDLIDRLSALTYPDDKLEVCFVVEQGDAMTRAALARAALSRRFRHIIVPRGRCMTKPRALNYALDFMQGDIIGVLDAEDAPASRQLLTVASSFANAGPEVACLQGALDFYNSRANWLSRCFTIEYASWFRVVLPGLQSLGLVLPLGGTTIYLRRDALERVGAWDAQNVTEDADLGLRLVRHGYRTQMIETTTLEEANARPWAWVRQRSRWLKGYAITYLVHMRQPRRLLRDLGLKRFLGVQVQFLATLVTFSLAPLLWSLILGLTAAGHPLVNALPPSGTWALSGVFILTECAGLLVGGLALHRAGKANLMIWLPAMMMYYPLATLAAYKALWELVRKPFYWDKTSHGVFAPDSIPEPDHSEALASSFNRVS